MADLTIGQSLSSIESGRYAVVTTRDGRPVSVLSTIYLAPNTNVYYGPSGKVATINSLGVVVGTAGSGDPPSPNLAGQTTSTTFSDTPSPTGGEIVNSTSQSSTKPVYPATASVHNDAVAGDQQHVYWVECKATATTTANDPNPTLGATCSRKSPPNKVDVGPTAAVGVMAVLFIGALVAGIFLFLRLRRVKKENNQFAAYVEGAENGSEARESRFQDRINELEANIQALLAQSQQPQLSTLDDNSVVQRFRQVDQGVKDWIINHFKSTEQRLELSAELRDILISQVPLFDRLLQQPKSRTLVLRAVVAYVLYKAFETGEFGGVGGGLSSLEESMEKNAPETEFNKWRAQTFKLLAVPTNQDSRTQSVTAVCHRIDTVLAPFCTTPKSHERLPGLSGFVEAAASLFLDLGGQLARFKVLTEHPEAPFRSTRMDDVSQTNETTIDPATGRSINALEGKPIQAVIFPSVVKWGDERGEHYDQMSVILKAKVLA